MNSTKKPLTVLVSGPYRSGTNGDPVLMKANLRTLEDAALKLFRKGHIPIVVEWLAFPLSKVARTTKIDDYYQCELLYPVAARIILKCDAVLRLPGKSKGADSDVLIALQNNIPVFYELDDLLKL